MPVFHQMHQFVLWLYPTVNKFPKNQRFVLGQRLERQAIDLIELLVEAKFSSRKFTPLKKASIKINTLLVLIRLARDLNFLSANQYEFASKNIDEISSMIGGWLKTESSFSKQSNTLD